VFWNNCAYLLPRLQREVAGKLPALTGGCELVGAGLEDRVGDYAALALVA
jgi:glucokinase